MTNGHIIAFHCCCSDDAKNVVSDHRELQNQRIADYFSAALAQCSTGVIEVGTITNADEFWENLDSSCIPQEIVGMTAQDYPDFLQKRRTMMAAKIRKYYYSL